MGASLLSVGICSVPERLTGVVPSFTRAICKQSAEPFHVFLKRLANRAIEHRWPTMEISSAQSAAYASCCCSRRIEGRPHETVCSSPEWTTLSLPLLESTSYRVSLFSLQNRSVTMPVPTRTLCSVTSGSQGGNTGSVKRMPLCASASSPKIDRKR